MPTSPVRKQPKPKPPEGWPVEAEFLYYLDEDGLKQDDVFHQELIDGGDFDRAKEVSRKVMQRLGLNPDVLLPRSNNKKFEIARRRAFPLSKDRLKRWLVERHKAARLITRAGGDWDESLHPRDEGGRFGHGGGGSEGARAPNVLGTAVPPKESWPESQKLSKFETFDGSGVGFLLPDGSSADASSWASHEAAARDVGTTLQSVLKEGTIRIVGETPEQDPDGPNALTVESHNPPTTKQIATLTRYVQRNKYEFAIIEGKIDWSTGVAQKHEQSEYGKVVTPLMLRQMIAKLWPELKPQSMKWYRFRAGDWDESLHPRDELGRFGHGGGGSEGGSAGDKESAKLQGKPASNPMTYRQLLSTVRSTAAANNFDSRKILIMDSPGPTFQVGGKTYHAAATADIHTHLALNIYPITVYQPHFSASNEKAAEGLISHEIEHIKFQTALNGYAEEERAAKNEPGPPPDPNATTWWGRRGGGYAVFKPDGTLRPPYAEKYPTYNAMHEAFGKHDFPHFAKTDGVSEYSRAYWEANQQGTVKFETAVHETLAEMARVKHETGKFPDHWGEAGHGLKNPVEAEPWRELYNTVEKVYGETNAAEARAEAAARAQREGSGGTGRAGARSPEQAQRRAEEAASGHAKLAGLPDKPIKIGDQWYAPGPYGRAREAAETYMREAKLPYSPPQQFLKVDRARATRIASEFDKMKHDPNNPRVKAAYAALAKETIAQWQVIKRSGLKVEWIKPGQEDPYAATPRLAAMDVIDNNHFWGYPTEIGYGSGDADTEAARATNPMLAMTDEVVGGRQLMVNDVFRIVHDYFGHFKDGVGFRADGEENAWRSHAAMFSELAREALTAETRGQNSWVNFGPKGEANRTATAADTVFAPQKIGLMPGWTVDEGRTDTASGPRPAPLYSGTETKVKVTADTFEEEDIALNEDTVGDEATRDKFVDEWNDKIGMDPAEFKKAMLGDLDDNATMEVGFVLTDTRIGSKGFLHDERGKRIGNYESYINTDKNEAYIDLVQVAKDQQGSGITKELMANHMETYKKLGISKVKLLANIDVGGYAWAKYGFVPDQLSWAGVRAGVRTRINEKFIGEDVYEATKVEDPKAVWVISDSKDGFKLLKNTAWKGTLDMNDKESADRFNAYISKRKK